MKVSKAALKISKDLGLSLMDAIIMDFKSKLYERASISIQKTSYTHDELAKLVGTSRARITRISNMGENSVSIEMLLKIIVTIEEKLPLKLAS